MLKLSVIEALVLRCGEQTAEQTRLEIGVEVDMHDSYLLRGIGIQLCSL